MWNLISTENSLHIVIETLIIPFYKIFFFHLYSILFWHIMMSKTAKNNLKHDTNSNSETWMALCIKIQILVFLFSAFQWLCVDGIIRNSWATLSWIGFFFFANIYFVYIMKMSGTSQKSKHLQVLCVAIELIYTMLIHIHKYPISIQHSMWKQTSIKFAKKFSSLNVCICRWFKAVLL